MNILGFEAASLCGDDDVDASFDYLLRSHPELESFKITGGEDGNEFTDRALLALFSHESMLTIQLNYCHEITGELQTGWKLRLNQISLKVLNLRNCKSITNIGLVCLLNLTGESLVELDLSFDEYRCQIWALRLRVRLDWNIEPLLKSSGTWELESISQWPEISQRPETFWSL